MHLEDLASRISLNDSLDIDSQGWHFHAKILTARVLLFICSLGQWCISQGRAGQHCGRGLMVDTSHIHCTKQRYNCSHNETDEQQASKSLHRGWSRATSRITCDGVVVYSYSLLAGAPDLQQVLWGTASG